MTCNYSGRDRGTVQFTDNHGNVYRLVIEKTCGGQLESHVPQSLYHNIWTFLLGVCAVGGIYCLLRRKRSRGEYRRVKEKE